MDMKRHKKISQIKKFPFPSKISFTFMMIIKKRTAIPFCFGVFLTVRCLTLPSCRTHPIHLSNIQNIINPETLHFLSNLLFNKRLPLLSGEKVTLVAGFL
jgi:hypothetical protein